MVLCKAVGVFVLVASFPGQTSAQSAHSPDAGSRVRLAAAAVSPEPLIGTIVSQDQTTLELQVADQQDPIVVPRDAITKMEMSTGRRSRGHGAWIGALAGGASGAIAVLATPEKPCDPGALFGCLRIISKGQAAAMLGGLGAGLGALIGMAIPPGEKWTAVPTGLRVSVAPTHKGDVQISLSFAF
jgi:hypothetical protein